MIKLNVIMVGQKPNQSPSIGAASITLTKTFNAVRANLFIFGGRFRYSSELLMPHTVYRTRTAVLTNDPLCTYVLIGSWSCESS